MRWRLSIGLLSVVCVAAMPALGAAGGFTVTDLTRLKIPAIKISGKDFVSRAEPKRLTFACINCTDFTAIDVLIDRSIDGTEPRFRSGRTSVSTIEANCRRSEPSCAIARIELNGAVGWVSRTRAVGSSVSTAVMFKNGDRLVIRSVAGAAQAAFDNGVAIRNLLAARIIG